MYTKNRYRTGLSFFIFVFLCMIIAYGIPFDTPDAIFKRYHNMSTFESLLKHYRLRDPKLIYIGKIIHDIEVNTWEKKIFEETLIVQDAVNKIIWNVKDRNEVIQKSCKYFDSLYQGAGLNY